MGPAGLYTGSAAYPASASSASLSPMHPQKPSNHERGLPWAEPEHRPSLPAKGRSSDDAAFMYSVARPSDLLAPVGAAGGAHVVPQLDCTTGGAVHRGSGVDEEVMRATHPLAGLGGALLGDSHGSLAKARDFGVCGECSREHSATTSAAESRREMGTEWVCALAGLARSLADRIAVTVMQAEASARPWLGHQGEALRKRSDESG